MSSLAPNAVKKAWYYLATSVDRQTRCCVAHALLVERTYDTMQPLVDQTLRLMPHVQNFYSDGLDTSQTLIYRRGRQHAQHTALPDKSQTYTVEGVNADLRCYVSALLRRSRAPLPLFCPQCQCLGAVAAPLAHRL